MLSSSCSKLRMGMPSLSSREAAQAMVSVQRKLYASSSTSLLSLLTQNTNHQCRRHYHRFPAFAIVTTASSSSSSNNSNNNPNTTTTTAIRWHGGGPDKDAPTVPVVFLLPDGATTKPVEARIGETLLQTAHRNEIDLEGACEGVCACSTCHLILPQDLYDSLPEPSEDEEDMLDMAFGLQTTSRLGCQVEVTAGMKGAVLELPKATRNFYVDGHVPKPH